MNAVSAYTEARTVSRRVYGLHNEEQIELLDRMSRSFLDLNQLSRSRSAASRSASPRAAGQSTGLRRRARGHLQVCRVARRPIVFPAATRSVRARAAHDPPDPWRARRRQVKPLLGIGNTYREERNPASMGISALQEALALLLEQPQRDPVATARALRDIGDWAVAFGKTGYSGTEYQRAWQMLGSAPNGDQLRREWFSGANYVLYEPISPRGLSVDPEALSGHVTVTFDIDPAGNTNSVTLVESNPVGLKDEAVLRHIRRSRFRPLLDNGVVVVGKGLAIQVKFRYLPEAARRRRCGVTQPSLSRSRLPHWPRRARSTRRAPGSNRSRRRARRWTACVELVTRSPTCATSAPRSPGRKHRRRATRRNPSRYSGGPRDARADPSGAAQDRRRDRQPRRGHRDRRR